eukprot:GHVU01226946.1.p1 GENE.GHVU01226946.1~~GHVU01226946.1.p1  ORF type:complete len:695 (+),score=80.79 GHVU01226946.1:331-2415(+)
MTAKRPNKSIFPLLLPETPYSQWCAQVELVKLTNEKWQALCGTEATALTAEKLAETEAAHIHLATAYHSKANAALLAVFHRRKAENLPAAEWLKQSTLALEKVCKPIDKDQQILIRNKLETLPNRAARELPRIPDLLTEFDLLRADASRYKVPLTEEALADILLRSAPSSVQVQLLLDLKDDAEKPDEVYARLHSLAQATGAKLERLTGTQEANGGPSAYFTDQQSRPKTSGPPRSTRQHRSQRSPCAKCGAKQGHASPSECRAVGKTCNYCGKPNHFAAVCRSRISGAPHGHPRPQQNGDGGGTALTQGGTQAESHFLEGTVWMTTTPELTPKEEKRIYLDTCVSESVFPKWAVEGLDGSIQSTPLTYRTTAGGNFTAATGAVIRLPVTLVDGGRQEIFINANVGPDTIPCLCKPKCIHLMLTPEDSWVLLEDVNGIDWKVKVDCPTGGPRRLPYLILRDDKVGGDQPSEPTCWHTVALTPDTLQGHHARLLDPCLPRLVGTMKEQGCDVTATDVKKAVGACSVCEKKNAVRRTPPRSTRRSEKGDAKKFDEVFWDFLIMHTPGLNNEKYVSLFVCAATLLWHAKALKQKSEAPTHLLEWIADYGAMKRLHSDNAPELKGTQVATICADNGILMPPSPPYTSEANGPAENANRQMRTLLKTFLHRLNLPFKYMVSRGARCDGDPQCNVVPCGW